jgi:Gamma-aminobutyrate permease and related permeases
MPNGITTVIGALLGVMFAFLGAEIVTIAASEAKDRPPRSSRPPTSVVWRVCLFYVGSIFLIVCLVPWNDPHWAFPAMAPTAVPWSCWACRMPSC